MNRWHHRVAADAGAVAGTALLACLIASLLAASVGMLTLLSALQFGPPVGEMIVFAPYDHGAPVWTIAAARASDHRRCRLQPVIMAESRGSMVVERRAADGRSFQVHWAGGPTSDGAGDCGSVADLTLGLPEIQTMLNAGQESQWHLFGP